MRKLIGIAVAAALAGCGVGEVGSGGIAANGDDLSSRSHAAVCPGSAPGSARCHARVILDAAGQPLATTAPAGFGALDLQDAYALPTTGGAGQTVAIVDAYDDPTAEADLGVYRKQYGLPPCTTANGCFKKVNQSGVQGSYPRVDRGWAMEISLDLDMVSAACPNCKILLVEANSAAMTDLGKSVNTAVALGANAVSNSYGGSEYAGETADEVTYFDHPGVAITVSSGDNGYGVEFPAASQFVTAVGGTSLKRVSGGRGFSESAWSGAGSGCSAYVTKPSWQTDGACARRSVADVSAVADPNTGVAIYDSTSYQGRKGWMVLGGTSASSPLVAAVYALAGNTGTINGASLAYTRTSSLFDVSAGSNGTCGGSYLCTAGAGYDGPTGLGTPNGTGAF